MKLQIDTTGKVIRVEGPVKISELFTVLDKMFPENEWRNFFIDMTISVKDYPSAPLYPVYPSDTIVPLYPSWKDNTNIYLCNGCDFPLGKA